MQRNQEKVSAEGVLVFWLVICNVVILQQGFISDPGWYKLGYVTLPLLLASLIFIYRKQLLKKKASVENN